MSTEELPESVSQNHPACRLSSGLFRTNGCPLNREEDCGLCGVVAFEPWYCSQVGDALVECPPEGCPLGQCALADDPNALLEWSQGRRP